MSRKIPQKTERNRFIDENGGVILGSEARLNPRFRRRDAE
jgi:hypothetical protein